MSLVALLPACRWLEANGEMVLDLAVPGEDFVARRTMKVRCARWQLKRPISVAEREIERKQ